MSDQAESVRTRNCTRLLYMPINTTAMTTRITRKRMPVMKRLLSSCEPEFTGTVTYKQHSRNDGASGFRQALLSDLGHRTRAVFAVSASRKIEVGFRRSERETPKCEG